MFLENTTRITYGSGNYIIYSSTNYVSFLKLLLFDYDVNNTLLVLLFKGVSILPWQEHIML
jgi:hypothetical protein